MLLLQRFFRRLVRTGCLRVIDATGLRHRFGSGEPHITIRLLDPALHWKLPLRPGLYAGEAYMDGTLQVEDGSIYDFLELIGRNIEDADLTTAFGPFARAGALLRPIQQFNPIRRARRNVAHHYDFTREFFELFLDADRQYSCAYFITRNDDLDTAQQQKCRHIAAKLMLAPGMRVLDIGCGWGGLALYLAEQFDVEVTGITLSEPQLAAARVRAGERRLAERVRFARCDYREVTGAYDRIVSVGMFEHVGAGHFGEFFRQVRDRLTEDGVALLHTIGRSDPPGGTNPWIRKYIFPGGYAPALSEVAGAVETSGLWLTDVEVWRLHYAETLRHWRQRFLARRSEALALYDERFCRMWEFYLACCEMAFRHMQQCVFQIQLAQRLQTLPLTRDYMLDQERKLAMAEQPQPRAAAAEPAAPRHRAA
jgi:cyclopropane-fatty-acyl-phospholipid synthase